jgi:hypothetical protein
VGDFSGEVEGVASNFSDGLDLSPASEPLGENEAFSLLASIVDMVNAMRRKEARKRRRDSWRRACGLEACQYFYAMMPRPETLKFPANLPELWFTAAAI